MPLSTGAKVGIGIGIVAGIAAIAGIASAKATPPAQSGYVLKLSPSSIALHYDVLSDFTVSFTHNGSPVSEAMVTLTDTTTNTSESTITDNQGIVIFSVAFPYVIGYPLTKKFYLQASASVDTLNIKSNIATVTASCANPLGGICIS